MEKIMETFEVFILKILTAGVCPVLSSLNPFSASDDKFFFISCALE